MSPHPETNTAAVSQQTARLAQLIHEDIRQRGFKAGERYLNGGEIAEKYGVSVIMANRALQSLAQKKVLERRRRAGTFIGGDYQTAKKGASNLRCVHLLMPTSYFRLSRANVEQAVTGLHLELPDAHLQYTFLPAAGELGFVQQWRDQLQAAGTAAGVVLYLSSAEIQQFFREAQMPAVVFGSVYPEAGDLPWVDRDQKQIGELMADFLLQEKHARVAVLMRERWGYGDNLFLDGVQRVFGQTKTPPSLKIRSVPSIETMAAGMIRALLKADDAPTALICRSEKLAATAALIAADLKLKIPKQLRIVVTEVSTLYPCVHPTISQEEQGKIIGRMLRQSAAGEPLQPDHLLVPVRLHHPLAS